MRLFDLTPYELRTLLRVGQAVGIHTELDLLRIAEESASGSQSPRGAVSSGAVP